MKTSWRRLSSSSTKDVFKTSWSRRIYWPYSCVFRRRLQDVLIKTNIFLSVIRLQDVLLRRLQNVFKTSCKKRLQEILTSARRFQNIFKTSSRHLQDVLLRRFQDVLKKSCKNVFKTSSRRLQDVLKTSSRHLAKMSSRSVQDVSLS